MIKNIDRKHAHLTLDNRIDIQQMLRDGFNFKMIANSLKKDPSTISKEVRKHIFVKESTSISPLDLPRKVKFKPRNKNNVTYVPNRVRVGRTYDDFLKFIKIHDISNWVKMDTVIGSQGGKVIMTWDFTFCNFMVGFLLDSKTASNVASAFFDIKSSFNENDIAFPDIVPLVLTDNGGEFSNADAIEQN